MHLVASSSVLRLLLCSARPLPLVLVARLCLAGRSFTETSRSGTGADVGSGSAATSFGAAVGGHTGHASTSSQGGKEGAGAKKAGNIFKSGSVEGTAAPGAAGEGGSASSTPLVEYTMMLHPPLVVENLLPHAGDFELVDQVG